MAVTRVVPGIKVQDEVSALMLMLTNQLRPVSSLPEIKTKMGLRVVGRLVQALVAIHLLPALLVVLVIGGVGMLVLGSARFAGTLRQPPVD